MASGRWQSGSARVYRGGHGRDRQHPAGMVGGWSHPERRYLLWPEVDRVPPGVGTDQEELSILRAQGGQHVAVVGIEAAHNCNIQSYSLRQ